MTKGTTVIEGVAVGCLMIGLSEMRVGPVMIKRLYRVVLDDGTPAEVDNFSGGGDGR